MYILKMVILAKKITPIIINVCKEPTFSVG